MHFFIYRSKSLRSGSTFKKEINVYPENKTKFIKYRKQFASEDFIETSPLDPIQFSDRTELLGNGGLGEKYSILKELIG